MKPKRNDSNGRPRRGARGLLAGIAAATALIVAPSGASAASSLYAPDDGARTFAEDTGGWTSANDSSGACVEAVLCPTVTNTYEADGGNDRDGFIRTAVGSLTGVGGTTTGTWTSPSFVYKGVDDADPDSLGLTLARRADVGELLSVAGNSATFDVELVGVSRKADSVTVLESRSLADADGWSQIRQIDIAPNQLDVGQRYQIAITTTYRTGATVVPGGSADYDDVVLKAKTTSTSGGGSGEGSGDGNGGNGGNGGGGDTGDGDGNGNGGNGTDGNGGQGDDGTGGGGAGTGSADDSAALAGSGIAGKAATLTDTGRLRVKVRCARKAGGPCKIKVKGLVRKHGPKLGKAAKVKVKSGKSRVIDLPVKPQLRSTLEGKHRVLVKQKVKANGHSASKVVRLKLRHS